MPSLALGVSTAVQTEDTKMLASKTPCRGQDTDQVRITCKTAPHDALWTRVRLLPELAFDLSEAFHFTPIGFVNGQLYTKISTIAREATQLTVHHHAIAELVDADKRLPTAANASRKRGARVALRYGGRA